MKNKPLFPAWMLPEHLDYFKETFEMLWNEGKSIEEISRELQFNDVENTPWEGRLKPHHAYYFASKWGLKKRNSPAKKRRE